MLARKQKQAGAVLLITLWTAQKSATKKKEPESNSRKSTVLALQTNRNQDTLEAQSINLPDLQIIAGLEHPRSHVKAQWNVLLCYPNPDDLMLWKIRGLQKVR